MYACLGANVVRFLLIAWLSNPWLILPLQALQGATLSVVWASATSYISLVSPSHLKANSQYILAILYNGVGKGIGPILGGMFLTSSGILFSLYNERFLYFRKSSPVCCDCAAEFGCSWSELHGQSSSQIRRNQVQQSICRRGRWQNWGPARQ